MAIKPLTLEHKQACNWCAACDESLLQQTNMRSQEGVHWTGVGLTWLTVRHWIRSSLVYCSNDLAVGYNSLLLPAGLAMPNLSSYPHHFVFRHSLGHNPSDILSDRVGGFGSVQFHVESSFLVVLHQRNRLGVIDGQTFAQRVSIVVRSANQRLSGYLQLRGNVCSTRRRNNHHIATQSLTSSVIGTLGGLNSSW